MRDEYTRRRRPLWPALVLAGVLGLPFIGWALYTLYQSGELTPLTFLLVLLAAPVLAAVLLAGGNSVNIVWDARDLRAIQRRRESTDEPEQN